MSFGQASIDVLPTTKDNGPRLLVTLYQDRNAMWSIVGADGQVYSKSTRPRRVSGWTVAEMGADSEPRVIACGPGTGGNGLNLWVRELRLGDESQSQVTVDGAREENGPVTLVTTHGLLITVEEWYAKRELKMFDADLTPMRCVADWPEWRLLQSSATRVRACDVDGDGYDELLCATKSLVWTMRVEEVADGVVRLSPPLWSVRNEDLSAEMFRFDAGRGIVIVRRGRMLQALALSSGKPRWYCPIPFADVFGMTPYQLIYGQDAKMDVPHLLFSNRERSYCVQATPGVAQARSSDEMRVGSASVARLIPDLYRSPPRLAPETHDPRLRAGLPWVPHPDYQDWSREFHFYLQSTILSLCLVVLPFGFALWIGTRRQWGLRTMLAAPFVIGVFISAVLMQSDQINQHGRFAMAFVPIPVILLGAIAVHALIGQRWWRLAGLYVTVAIMCLLTALYFLATDRRLLGQTYFWDGWYWILLYGTYQTGCLLVLTSIPYVPVTAWLRRRSNRPRYGFERDRF